MDARTTTRASSGLPSGPQALNVPSPTRAVPEALAEQAQIIEQLDKELTRLLDRISTTVQPYPCPPSDSETLPDSPVQLVACLKRNNRKLDTLLDAIRNTEAHCQL